MRNVFLVLYSKEYHPAFRKDLKKLDKPVVKEIEKCVIEIANTPALREELTGDLVGILSYHLKLNGTEYRIAYTVEDEKLIIYFVSVASRENFYKALSRRVG